MINLLIPTRTFNKHLIVYLTPVILFVSCITYASSFPCLLTSNDLNLTEKEALTIANRIWQNESGGDPSKILWWNPGEEFLSAGIGHFIWYSENYQGPFEESFPQLIKFLKTNHVTLPNWLNDNTNLDSPWENRETFLAERHSERAQSLEAFLNQTRQWQVKFLVSRLVGSISDLTATSSEAQASLIYKNFCALSKTPEGRYALIDYVNFKGEGTNPKERYNEMGWASSKC